MEKVVQFHQSDTIIPPAMTFDEASLQRSKTFVKALQELKNMRPQLYSAAEYCEKSYLHSEQKQMLLDNLKDYAVRALVNAVDHLGTVAYKLTELVEQQSKDVSTLELKLTCMNQQLLTCHTYMDKEGLRQLQLLTIIPRHHKRYVLPYSINKKVQFNPHVQLDTRQMNVEAKPRIHPSGAPGSNMPSWHLAFCSDTQPALKGTSNSTASPGVQLATLRSPGTFHLLDNDGSVDIRAFATHQQLPSRTTALVSTMQSGVKSKLLQEPSIISSPKTMSPFRSFDTKQQQIVGAPARRKSVFSAFFVKQKTSKLKAGTVS